MYTLLRYVRLSIMFIHFKTRASFVAILRTFIFLFSRERIVETILDFVAVGEWVDEVFRRLYDVGRSRRRRDAVLLLEIEQSRYR